MLCIVLTNGIDNAFTKWMGKSNLQLAAEKACCLGISRRQTIKKQIEDRQQQICELEPIQPKVEVEM